MSRFDEALHGTVDTQPYHASARRLKAPAVRLFGRYEHRGIPIYNVSVVDESYRLVNAPTVIDLPGV